MAFVRLRPQLNWFLGLFALIQCAACSNPPEQNQAKTPVDSGNGNVSQGTGGTSSTLPDTGLPDANSGGALANGAGSAGASASDAGTANKFAWPNAERAAVTLTYDDGIKSQLDFAAPELDKHGLKGTFFTSGDHGALPFAEKDPLDDYQSKWAKLAASGHELAGHTFSHPCEARLSTFTLENMRQDLDQSIRALRALGALGPLTFAYPCASDVSGIGTPRASYAPLIAERFLAARVAKEGIADPLTVALQHVPMLDAAGKTSQEMQEWVNQAITLKGWLVIMFHGVGGDYLTTTSAAHAELLRYLAEHKTEVWTATLRDAALHITQARK